jgi:hypothetical protein
VIDYQPATLRDAVWVGANLRPEDEQEVRTVTGAAPHWAVPVAYRSSKTCIAMRYRNSLGTTTRRPLAIYGVADDPNCPELGSVWMLATPRISRVSVAFIKAAPAILDDLGAGYAGLHCVADARNHLHLRWLDRCAFSRNGEVHINGHAFIHFIRLNNKDTI